MFNFVSNDNDNEQEGNIQGEAGQPDKGTDGTNGTEPIGSPKGKETPVTGGSGAELTAEQRAEIATINAEYAQRATTLNNSIKKYKISRNQKLAEINNRNGLKYDLVENDLKIHNLTVGVHKLADVVSFPEIYTAYPELKDYGLIFKIDSTIRNIEAQHNRISKQITVKSNKMFSTDTGGGVGLEDKATGLKSVIAYEIQHAVQAIEGFESGTNPGDAFQYYANRIYKGITERAGYIYGTDANIDSEIID